MVLNPLFFFYGEKKTTLASLLLKWTRESSQKHYRSSQFHWPTVHTELEERIFVCEITLLSIPHMSAKNNFKFENRYFSVPSCVARSQPNQKKFNSSIWLQDERCNATKDILKTTFKAKRKDGDREMRKSINWTAFSSHCLYATKVSCSCPSWWCEKKKFFEPL